MRRWVRPGAWTVLLVGLALVTQPASAALFINEIDADTAGSDTLEFIEIYNSGPGAVDFAATPHVVVLFNGNGDVSYDAIDLTGTLPAGGFFTIGSTGMGTDIEKAPGTTGWLQNGADAVGLYTGTSAAFPSSTAPTTTNLVDAIVYDTNDADDAALLAALGETVQYDEDGTGAKDTTSIARQPDGGGFQVGQIPTPGSGNGLPSPTANYSMTALYVDDSNVPVTLCGEGGTGALTFNVETLPALGTLSDNSGAFAAPRAVNGPLTYTPNPGVSGLDSFDFSVTDTNNLTSDIAVHELAIQQDSVVISEVMHSPSSFDSTFEYVEIYNYGATSVSLGRIDNNPASDIDTTDNLTTNGVPVIPAGQYRIIAIDNTIDFPESAEEFRCEWRLAESDIIRVPLSRWEFLFTSGQGNDNGCPLGNSSRILLFDSSGGLLDAVDLSVADATAGDCEGTSLSMDPLFENPTSASNDVSLNWACAVAPFPGGQTGEITGDSATPAIVPVYKPTRTLEPSCFGACCLTDGTCEESVLEADCLAATCGDASRWKQGLTCGSAGCPAPEPFGQCCLPIGECIDTSECECLLTGGDWDGAQTCATGPQCSETARLIINELEYDNPGTDDAEYVELKAPGGASLAGWKLEFYNGNGNVLYQEVDLSLAPNGIMPADGYLVVGSANVPEVDLVAWGDNGIQNGPDGVALVIGSFVVEGLSYETGTNGLVPVDGTAAGMLLKDSGVSDTSTTTMQKIPDGNTDSNGWVQTNNQTPGEANFDAGAEGACCDPNTLECVRVTSIECDGLGGIYQGDGTSCGVFSCLPTGSCCEPDGNCRDDLAEIECGRLGGDWTEGGACPDIAGFVGCLTGPSSTDVRAPECQIWDLDADGLDIDLADFAKFQQLPLCAPDPVGACCLPDGSCIETDQWTCETFYGPGRFQGDGVACGGVSCPADPAGAVLINEIWAEDPGVDDHEFIELFAAPSTDLSSYSLIIVDGDTDGSTDTFQWRRVNFQADLAGYSTDANGFFLMGTGTSLAGIVDVDMDAVFGNSNGLADEIQNGAQTYALVPTADIEYCTGTGVPDATCDTNGMRLTQASYDTITASAIDTVATRFGDFDHFYFFAPLVQDEGIFVFDYAQRIPNGTDTNVAGDWETVFGNELGDPGDPSTPGATNTSLSSLQGACCINNACQLLTDAQCALQGGNFLGQGSTCSPIDPCDCRELSQIPDIVFPDPGGDPVCVTNAIVSNTYDLINSTTSKSFYIQDRNSVKGWAVFGTNEEIDALLDQIEVGDVVEMTGTHEEYFTLQELVAPFTLTVLSTEAPPTPLPRIVDDFNENYPVNSEYMAVLVRIQNARFSAADVGNTFQYGNYTIEDASNPAITMLLRVGNGQPGALPIVGTTIPSGAVDIVGVMGSFSNVWQVFPRVPEDITVVGP